MLLAVARAASTHEQWDECRASDLEGLCAANQDALIDDWWEDPDLAGDPVRQAELRALVAVYDELLGTSRVTQLDDDALVPETCPLCGGKFRYGACRDNTCTFTVTREDHP